MSLPPHQQQQQSTAMMLDTGNNSLALGDQLPALPVNNHTFINETATITNPAAPFTPLPTTTSSDPSSFTTAVPTAQPSSDDTMMLDPTTAPVAISSTSSSTSPRITAASVDRSHRAAAREQNRAAMRSSVSAISNATGVDISESSLLRAQAARERDAEARDMATDDPNEAMIIDDDASAAAASSSSKPKKYRNNTDATSSSAAAAPSSSAPAASLDDDISAEDMQFLDEDTKSRTKYNKHMRNVLKDALVKQERFIRRHIAEFRAFLTPKLRLKYEGNGTDETAGEDSSAMNDVDAQNLRAGALAAELSASNPSGTRVDLPSTTDANIDSSSSDIVLPTSKVFTVQPPYIINGTMRQYQVQGLNWMINRHENCVGGILGDEMGLGKTLQVISFLSYLKYECKIAGPHLIVAPLSVMSAWMTEFKRWSPGMRVVRYHGPLGERRRLQNDDASYGKFDVILTTYEMIVGDEDFFRFKFIWQYVIVDEAHRIKNEKTLQAQSLASIQRYNCILLSGTPTQNNTHEIWALLHFLLPRVFVSSEPFDRCFDLLTNSIDRDQLFLIHTLLRPLMLRRIKAQIETSLPKKTETKIFVGLTELQREWYKKLVSRDMNLLIGQGSAAIDAAHAAASSSASSAGYSDPPPSSGAYAHSSEWRRLQALMMQLRKVCNHPFLISGEAEPNWEAIKKREAEEDLRRIRSGQAPIHRESIASRAGKALIESGGKMQVLDKLLTKLKAGGHRVLLFSLFTRVLDLLEDYLNYKGWSYLRLDGSTNRVRRSVDIRRFNDNPRFFIYLISTRAGGLGITLTAAETVIHYDSDFNPQADLQAQDRCHRIGQTKPVHVYRFITENTVEERLIARAEKKLYLDKMVNRLSHADPSGEHLLGSEQEELVKLTKDEMLSILTFGASRIFKATDPTATHAIDEDIDVILKRSAEKDEQTKSEKMKQILGARSEAAAAGANVELPDEEAKQIIANELAELQLLNAQAVTASSSSSSGDVELTEQKNNNDGATPKSRIIENAQRSLKDFQFEDEDAKKVHIFEGTDYSSRKGSRSLADLNKADIVETGVKRERKQRLVTVEDARGRAFTILASQQDDLPMRPTGKRKRGRPSLVKQEPVYPMAVPAIAPIQPAVPAQAVLEPKVIGHDYAINWGKSSVRSASDLINAVDALNRLDLGGVDVTDNAHKLTLHITKSVRWNMSPEDKLAYDRRIQAELKQNTALLNAKRRRWEEGAPEEAWLGEEQKTLAKAPKQKKQVKSENGEYVYNNKYIHEDWCHLCKLGGELLCCGYCPRVYHHECVGLKATPSGFFVCPQHKCSKCERSSQEAGGMLFRCVVCPCSYCEDDLPTEYEGRKDLDRCFELEMTGYSQPSSAFFITCSHSCTKYYQNYLEGKGAEEEQELMQLPDSAAAAASSSSSASASTDDFLFVPPTEIPPHVCQCLIPKKAKPKLYCICKTPYDKTRNYIACDTCAGWYHNTCVGLREDQDVELIEWTCKPCQVKDKQKASKASGVFELDSEADESSSESESEAEAGDASNDADSDAEEASEAAKKKRGRPSMKGAKSKPRNSMSSKSSPRSSKKSKIRHPIDGGVDPLAASAAASGNIPQNYPTLEQVLAMNFGLATGGVGGGMQPGGSVGQMAAAALAGGNNSGVNARAPFPGGFDPASFSQMMQLFGSSGSMVNSDGTVSNTNASLPNFAAMNSINNSINNSITNSLNNMNNVNLPMNLASMQQQSQQLQLQQQQLQHLQQQQQQLNANLNSGNSNTNGNNNNLGLGGLNGTSSFPNLSSSLPLGASHPLLAQSVQSRQHPTSAVVMPNLNTLQRRLYQQMEEQQQQQLTQDQQMQQQSRLQAQLLATQPPPSSLMPQNQPPRK